MADRCKAVSMAAQEIEYIELYATDQSAVLDYYINSLGFTRVATAARAATNSVLLRQGKVQLIVTSGPGSALFLDEHGDGIADVALNCDNVAAVADAAALAGARVHTTDAGHPSVTGFGGVSHTLLPMPAGDNLRLPPGRPWEVAPTASASPNGRIRLLDHVAICLEGGTLVDHADSYLAAFGLARYSSEYVAVGDQAMDSIVVRSPSGGITFTLVAPDPARKPGQLNEFLARNGGPGVQHLAFAVDNIISAVGEVKDRGVEFLSVPPAYYDKLTERLPDLSAEIGDLRASSVLADRDEWGYLLQIFTRSPHERNTLFYEFIQREGSHGFGSANIRALYEAVERNRLTVS
ncbi:4-hydroxyphenylpyruvate dioxygenase [Saccharothrix sp. ALI-22-I]|nr:4-hydroxyphenylpyruvate dioxygenase [Saccharothrix sp. ALI-22-I]